MKTVNNIHGHYIDLAKDKVKKLKGVIAYCQKAIDSNLEVWERKEYISTMEKAKIDLGRANKHLEYLLNKRV